MHTQTIPDSDYRAALKWTSPENFNVPASGSSEESIMLDGVESLFSKYTQENLADNLKNIYAEKLYFRDAFKQFSNHDDLRDYMLAGLEPLEASEFVFNRIARSGGDFYIDWTMRLDFKSTPTGTWEESIGVSHFRFNDEGKVIFHQDYWDPTDIVYRRIPVAKQLIGYVKGKL